MILLKGRELIAQTVAKKFSSDDIKDFTLLIKSKYITLLIKNCKYDLPVHKNKNPPTSRSQNFRVYLRFQTSPQHNNWTDRNTPYFSRKVMEDFESQYPTQSQTTSPDQNQSTYVYACMYMTSNFTIRWRYCLTSLIKTKSSFNL